MTEFKTRAFAGIVVGLTVAGLMSMGCSSSSNNTGTAGTTGSAGTGAGTAGTTGHAGTTGTAGTTGSAGTSGGACTAPTTKTIRDFSVDGGTALSSGTPYTFQDTGLNKPTVDTSTGALKVSFDTGVPTTMYPYAGVGVPFDMCADLTTSTGVKFNITGSLSTGCTIQFSLIDEKHSSSAPLGMCTGSCYPGGKVFTLPSSAMDVTINFADIPQGGTGSDTTVPPVVPSLATGVQWQLNIPGGEAGSACTGNITITNISLVP